MKVWIDEDGDIVWLDPAYPHTRGWTDLLRDGVHREEEKNGYSCFPRRSLWMILE